MKYLFIALALLLASCCGSDEQSNAAKTPNVTNARYEGNLKSLLPPSFKVLKFLGEAGGAEMFIIQYRNTCFLTNAQGFNTKWQAVNIECPDAENDQTPTRKSHVIRRDTVFKTDTLFVYKKDCNDGSW